MTPKGPEVIRDRDDILYDTKGHGDLCGWFYLVYDPKRSRGHNRGHRDLLYDPKGHSDLCGQFDLLFDPKRSRGQWRSPWPTLWPQRSQWPLWSVWPSLWPKNVIGSLEVAVTYFMTPKLNLTFDLKLELGYYLKRSRGHKWSRWPTLWPQRSTWPLTLTLT